MTSERRSPPTARSRIVSVVLLTLLVCASVGPAVAAGNPTTQADIDDRQAKLAIDQPHYVDPGVRVTTANGSRVYHARGGELELTPQNFDPSAVVDFGMETNAGRLSYDSAAGEFVLSTDKQGTFALYWVVAEQVAVNETVENQSANNTTSVTRTETRQVRYHATVRVEGQTSLVHLNASDLNRTKADAEKWEEFNATASDLTGRSVWVKLGLQPPMTTQQLMQSMVNAWLLVNDPIAALTGDSSVLIVLFMTLSGIFFLGMLAGYHTIVIAWLYRRLNIHEVTESAEGDLASRFAALDDEERKRRFAKRDFVDVFGDDHVADAMRALGDNPLEATQNWLSRLRQRNVVHDRLQAMHQAGYVAVVDRVATDGGDGGAGGPTARVVHEDDVDEDDDLPNRSLDVDPDDDLLDDLDWSQAEIREFDYVGSDVDLDRQDLNTHVEEFDLTTLLELSDLDMAHFSDDVAAGEYLRDLLADIREHPLTDEEGRIQTLRFGLERFLQTACLMEDRYELPVGYYVDMVDRAVETHDERREALTTLSDVKEGRYAA